MDREGGLCDVLTFSILDYFEFNPIAVSGSG